MCLNAFSFKWTHFVIMDCSFVKMIYCLNPNFVLQSIIILIVNILSIKTLLDFFFLVHLQFLWFQRYFNVAACKLFDLILLYVFHLATIFRHYQILFLCHFYICFSAYINHIYVVYSTEVSRFLRGFFCLTIFS